MFSFFKAHFTIQLYILKFKKCLSSLAELNRNIIACVFGANKFIKATCSVWRRPGRNLLKSKLLKCDFCCGNMIPLNILLETAVAK